MSSVDAQPLPKEVAPPGDAFRFGRNWQRYVEDYLDQDRERIAGESLRDLVGDLEQKTFLDIGCGSGLFSLCAYRAGAARVVSVDVDADAVESTRRLHARAGRPDNWTILHRSILDSSLGEDLDAADVVYSWGVLHHTGDMYAAIRNATAMIAPGGRIAIAIYNRVTDTWLDSERWGRIKRAYNHTGRPGQLAMEALYGTYWLLGRLRSRENPVRVAREYRRSRGMALRTDLVDWLGGYPYEFGTIREIVDFCESCGLRQRKIIPEPGGGTGNNQFVFERPAAAVR
jgi:2-polyprenyl-6-hydroxyphenyl methylase/3-demethylubiquinone-9 3-methyltransferase